MATTAREIFQAALSLDPTERGAFLSKACGADQDLLDEAQRLLHASSSDASEGETRHDTAAMTSAFGEGAPGTFIGPYRLVRRLGEGGMGDVYQAQQLYPMRRDVALKIIKPGMDSKQVVARFESERQALAMMDHANIARVFDAGTTPTRRPYFVMELVDGVPITRYCDSKRLTVRERIELFIPVCHAIQHAHQKGVIHRDIKPSNLLVAEHDGRATPKVIDFGLAKALGQELTDATLVTNVGTVIGTLEYMSPEQAELTRHDIDTRSDVYSLGVVLYELLTATTPLKHESLATAAYVQVLERIREEEAAPPSVRLRRSPTLAATASQRGSDSVRLRRQLHGELDWIVTKALEKDRSRRYETVNGLAQDLERFLEGEPVTAGPHTATYHMRKFVGKHRLGLIVAAAFVALLVAGVAVSSWMAVRASRAEQVARAVNDFLQNDLLAQAGADAQAGAGSRPDPDLKVRTALDRAAARIEGKFSAQPVVEASIRETIGKAYNQLGLLSDAQRETERALDLRRRALGEEHPDTLRSAARLAGLYTFQGKFAQAEPILTQVLEIQRRTQGEEHPDTLTSMQELAIFYRQQAKYPQAEALNVKLLEASPRVRGEEHPDTLTAMNNLALIYQLQGKYSQGEALLSRTLAIRRRVQGEDHPDTLDSTTNLAQIIFIQGRYAEAEPILTRALDVRRRVLGEAHPTTLNNMNDLASVYRLQGKYAEAESLLNKVLEGQRRVFGEEHSYTLITMQNLAVMYRLQGRYAESESLFTRALEGQRRAVGDQHPNIFNVMQNQALLRRLQGKSAEAEALLTKVNDFRSRALGETHPETLNARSALAEVYLDQSRYGEAEVLLRDVLGIQEKSPVDNWRKYSTRSLLGASLTGLQKYAEAEPLLLTGYEGMLQRAATMPAESKPRLKETEGWIGRLYQGWGKPERVSVWQTELKARGAVPK